MGKKVSFHSLFNMYKMQISSFSRKRCFEQTSIPITSLHFSVLSINTTHAGNAVDGLKTDLRGIQDNVSYLKITKPQPCGGLTWPECFISMTLRYITEQTMKHGVSYILHFIILNFQTFFINPILYCWYFDGRYVKYKIANKYKNE